jgi:hypothetical protein
MIAYVFIVVLHELLSAGLIHDDYTGGRNEFQELSEKNVK